MAFKVIRDFVPKPQLMFLCDKQCGNFTLQSVEPGTEHRLEVQQAFAVASAEAGWRIGFEEHVCPQHVAKQRAAVSGLVLATSIS